MACTCNLGCCLCPRCLIPKDRVQNLATRQVFLQQMVLAHTNTTECQTKVTKAHKLIYDKNYAVDMAQVEVILKSESLVPMAIGWLFRFVITTSPTISECILWKTQTCWVWFFQYACGGSLTWVRTWHLKSHIHIPPSHPGQLEKEHDSWAW